MEIQITVQPFPLVAKAADLIITFHPQKAGAGIPLQIAGRAEPLPVHGPPMGVVTNKTMDALPISVGAPALTTNDLF